MIGLFHYIKIPADAIYNDFSCSFGNTVHSKLLDKLQTFGISGNLLSLICAFLSDRSQSIVIENCSSSWVSVRSGVPQGSVLGPILFILFINDIAEICCGTVKHELFADDVKPFSEITLVSAGTDLQESLSMLESRCSA